MSITQAAEILRSYGRGKDTELVHVSPRELGALQAVAKAAGGSLTTNPNTGLPEAGFLEDILPTIAGVAVGTLTGNPWLGAATAGIGGTALGGGDLMRGVTAGLGAFGGASLLGSLGQVGGAASAANALGGTQAASAVPGLAEAASIGAANPALVESGTAGLLGEAMEAGALSQPNLGAGIEQLFNDPSGTWQAMGGWKGQGLNVGMMAAPLLYSAYNQESDNQVGAPQESDAYIRPFTYDPRTQRYTALTPVKTSDWGSRNLPGYNAGGQPVAEEAPRKSPAIMGLEFMAKRRLGLLTPEEMNQVHSPSAPSGGGITQLAQPAYGTQEHQTTSEPVPAPSGIMTSGPVKGMMTTVRPPKRYAAGGIASLPKFQAGGTLESDSFVIPADVVSALGNGSTDAGVRRLNELLGVAIPIEGPGDGLSDDVPATIDGQQPALVADGEVYLPPGVVASVGGGDPERGAELLYKMMDEVRRQAHGSTEQQEEVDPGEVFPME